MLATSPGAEEPNASLWLEVNATATKAVRMPPDMVLAEFLRDEIGCTDVKVACGEGACGACTVLVDGEATLSCLLFVGRAGGGRVHTAAYLAQTRLGQALVSAFVAHGAMQCGYCTPGWLCAAYALVQGPGPAPGTGISEWLERSLVGHLCRCTGYRPILDAIEEVARAELEAQPDGRTAKSATTD